jgi:hypothetical protein
VLPNGEDIVGICIGQFFENSVFFNPLLYVLGLRGAAECIKFHSDHRKRGSLVST